ncbi:MAG: hypothetical protein PHN49_06735 [Candidatus Omnitrophica bacterium]|nr:hypothetical protein [Candidatus Omnitrophota bacterium]
MKNSDQIMQLFTSAFKRKVRRVLAKETPAVASMVKFYLYGSKSDAIANVGPEDLIRAQILSQTLRICGT